MMSSLWWGAREPAARCGRGLRCSPYIEYGCASRPRPRPLATVLETPVTLRVNSLSGWTCSLFLLLHIPRFKCDVTGCGADHLEWQLRCTVGVEQAVGFLE